MERTAVVSIVDGCQIEFDACSWETYDHGLIRLLNGKSETVALLNQAHVKYIAFREAKPEPTTEYALGHKDDKNTGLSAGDRAVVIQTADPWNCLTVDIVGHIADDHDLVVTKRRGEVACRLYDRRNLRPVPEERRNESR